MEVKNICMTKSYNICSSEKIPITMNWLGHEGPHFVQTLVDDEEERYKTSAGLFNTLNAKFQP